MTTVGSRLPSNERRGTKFAFNRSDLILWSIFIVAIVLVFSPIIPIIYQSVIDRPLYDPGKVFTLDNYIRLFQLPAFRQAVVNTLILAVLATIVAQVVGVVLAILVGRTNLPGRRIFGEFMLWPLYISTLVLAFGWFMMYGSAGYVTLLIRSVTGSEPWSLYTIGGMAIVAGISQAPLTILYCLGSTALADSTLEDAARCCGANQWRTLTRVTLPLLTPAIIYSGALNFTMALETLSVPLIFGEPVGIRFFTTLIYSEGINASRRDYGIVGTASSLLLVVVAILVFIQIWLLRNSRRFISVGGKARRAHPFDLGKARWPVFFAVGIFVLFAVILPIGVLILRAFVSFLTPLVPFWTLFTLSNYTDIFAIEAFRRSITNTIFLAVVGGALATFFTAMLALAVHRSSFRHRRALEYVALTPRALPGMIAGIGFFYAMMIFPPFGWLQNTVWILVVAYTMRFIPTGFGAMSPALFQIGPELDRSARVIGTDWWGACRAIILPLMKPALVSCFALMFVHIVKEYAVAIFLFAPGTEVIGSTLLGLWVQGHMGRVAALSTIQIAITFIFVYAAKRLLGVKIYG